MINCIMSLAIFCGNYFLLQVKIFNDIGKLLFFMIVLSIRKLESPANRLKRIKCNLFGCRNALLWPSITCPACYSDYCT